MEFFDARRQRLHGRLAVQVLVVVAGLVPHLLRLQVRLFGSLRRVLGSVLNDDPALGLYIFFLFLLLYVAGSSYYLLRHAA